MAGKGRAAQYWGWTPVVGRDLADTVVTNSTNTIFKLEASHSKRDLE